MLDMRSGKRGQPRDPTPEGDRMLLNTYLERDKHQDGQCSCTPTARCRSFHRLTEHMIKAHSEALTRRWLDWLFQESFHPPKEVVKKLADEDATRRIKQLEDQVEGLRKQVANNKQEEETLIIDMEVTGQALEDMQEQNSRLIQQLREKDDANFKLMSERIKSNQIARLAREEKEMYIQQVATLTTQVNFLGSFRPAVMAIIPGGGSEPGGEEAGGEGEIVANQSCHCGEGAGVETTGEILFDKLYSP